MVSVLSEPLTKENSIIQNTTTIASPSASSSTTIEQPANPLYSEFKAFVTAIGDPLFSALDSTDSAVLAQLLAPGELEQLRTVFQNIVQSSPPGKPAAIVKVVRAPSNLPDTSNILTSEPQAKDSSPTTASNVPIFESLAEHTFFATQAASGSPLGNFAYDLLNPTRAPPGTDPTSADHHPVDQVNQIFKMDFTHPTYRPDMFLPDDFAKFHAFVTNPRPQPVDTNSVPTAEDEAPVRSVFDRPQKTEPKPGLKMEVKKDEGIDEGSKDGNKDGNKGTKASDSEILEEIRAKLAILKMDSLTEVQKELNIDYVSILYSNNVLIIRG